MLEQNKDKFNQAIDLLASCGNLNTMFDEGGILREMTAALANKALEAEMEEHLNNRAKYEHSESLDKNYRNGYTHKEVTTANGVIEVSTPSLNIS